MFYIGIDLGTSAVKLLLMDENGMVLRTVQKEYPLSFPKTGWSEQNPEDWWTQTRIGIRDLMEGFDSTQVDGLSFSGQMHGLVLLDERDQVIRPAILWNDGRTAEETEWLNSEIGEERLADLTGNIAFAGFTAPKLLWVRKHEPENFRRIRRIMLPKDYLAYRMTGVHSTDYSDAAGMLLLDTAHKCWSAEMLYICGVTKEQMPRLFESWQVIGNLTGRVAQDLGLPPHVRVCAGAGDNAAAAVGTDTLSDGSCNISVGTSGTIFIACDQFHLPKNHALHSFAHASGRYHLMGCMLSAAACNQWWVKTVLNSDDFAGEQKKIQELGTNPVFFAPYLMGERTPYNDTEVRGAFVGLSLNTDRGQMTQAVLEGVAFSFRDALELARGLGVPTQRATICGGGAKSPLWRTIMANILNIQIDYIQNEGPAMGAAMLAAKGCGACRSLEELAARTVRITESTLPTPELVTRYEQRYQTYRKIYPALHSLN
ncbi:MAG: xylulokinase [Clostridiales bacterium]|nr:xylulokinase [Clostridiales bacterium]